MPLPLHPPSNSPPGKRENAHKGAALKPSPRLPSIVVDQGGQKKKGSSMLHSKGFSYKDKKKKAWLMKKTRAAAHGNREHE